MTQTEDRQLGLRGIVLLLCCAFVPMMDAFIAGVALPDLRRDFRLAEGSALLTLVMVGYLAGFGSLLIIGGRIGDRFGRCRVLWWASVGFLAASALCGLAPNLAVLIAGRVLQGAAAGFVMPQILGLLSAHAGSRRDRAISWYSSLSGLSALIGLIGGSVLLDLVAGDGAWRWLFLMNVPIGLVGVALLRSWVPDTAPNDEQYLDRRGAGLLSVTVLAALLAASIASTAGPAATGLALLAALGGGAWIRHQRSPADPIRPAIVPPGMFDDPVLRRALLVMLPFFAGAGAFLYALPQTLQEGLGYTPLQAGAITTPMALGFLVASFAVPRLRSRIGDRAIALGACVQGGGLVVTAAGVATTAVPLICAGLLLIGCGQGITLGAMNAHLLALIPDALAGMGAGVLLTAQQVSIALGAAVLGTVYSEMVQAVNYSVGMITVLGIQTVLAAVVISAVLRRVAVRR